MAEGNTFTAVGASGSEYPFWVYPWGTTLKPTAGVYLVLRRESDGKYTILYVGQTADMSERFDAHHKEPCFTRNGVTHLAARLENFETKRLAIEADLVQNYRPCCNG
jgi:predicted GIY-YIG superfamily endonuclease